MRTERVGMGGFRTARVGGLLLLGLAWAACGDDDGGGGAPVELTVDTFNVALAGAFIPAEAERRQPIADAIAALPSDVVCLQEVWRQSDKDLIVEAARATFPYSVAFTHDTTTPVDDPRDQSGAVPPAPSGAPCGSDTLRAALDDALACLRDSCSTMPGSDEGRTTSTACAQSSCLSAVTPLLFGDAAALQCYACVATSLPTDTFSGIRDMCTTRPNAVLAFGGQSGVVVLSRHPLRDARAVVLPGTWNQRVIARATVELPDAGDLDVYCNHLTPIFDSPAFPYTGAYGDGAVGRAGWEEEQRFQVERLLALVASESAGRRAVIAGDFNAGRAEPGASPPLVDEGGANLTLLETGLTRAVAPGYVPICTFCPDNAITGAGTDPVWIDHIFLSGIPASAVRSTARTFVEPTVSTPDGMVPLSDHYGLRAVIELAP